MLSQEEIAAIKLLVGKVDIAAAQGNPNALNQAVERGLMKFLEHYQLQLAPAAFTWTPQGVQFSMVLVNRPQPVEPAAAKPKPVVVK